MSLFDSDLFDAELYDPYLFGGDEDAATGTITLVAEVAIMEVCEQ